MKTIGDKELSKIINVALASSRIKSLKTPHRIIRSSIHLLMYGNIGSGKSSIMEKIEDELNLQHYFNLTKAHIIGSVDKNIGELIIPAVWECRNSVMLVDEFFVSVKDYSGRDALRLLLSVMEKPSYAKKVGYRCNDFNEEEGELFCKVKKNKIMCKTRFVFFGNTMMNLRGSKIQEITALKSRCLVIPYYPTLEDLKAKARGLQTFKYKNYKVKDHVKISKKIYEKILDLLDERKISTSRYLRAVGDLCRVYAVAGFDEELFKIILDMLEEDRFVEK